MEKKILILGHGEIGSALGKILFGKGLSVVYWDKNSDKRSPNLVLEKAAHEADFIFLCMPSWFLREALSEIKPFLRFETILICLSKGLEESGKRVDEVIKETVRNNFVLMSGPMLAEEILRGDYGFAVLAGSDLISAENVRELFLDTKILTKIVENQSTVAMAGVLKNVYALALGIVSELGYGDNLRGYLMAKILEEWDFLADIFKLDKSILWGQAGEADFIATSISPCSKNHEAGTKIVQGKLKGMESEGLKSLPALLRLISEKIDLNNEIKLRNLINLKRIILDQEPAKEVFKFAPQK